MKTSALLSPMDAPTQVSDYARMPIATARILAEQDARALWTAEEKLEHALSVLADIAAAPEHESAKVLRTRAMLCHHRLSA